MSWWQQDTPSGDTANLDRFLSFVKKAEGGEPNIIVGGGRFSDFSQHPRIVGLRTKEGPSTAAGDYQITASTYDDVAPKIGVTGFTPADQRAIAVELIRRKGALEDINGGDFNSAINKLGSTWASLPSSPYSQPKKSWDETNKMLGTQVASAKASENWWSKDTPVTDAGAQSNWWAGDTPVDAPAAAVGLPQPTPSPALQATPQATPQVAPAPAVNPAAAISTEQPLGERIKRSLGIGTRDVLEGIDKYNPARAAFDFAGGVAGLAGATKARDYITNNLGMNAKQTLGSNIADRLGLAKPETQTEKTVSAGIQGASGLLTGTALSNAVSKAPQAVQAASNILLPAVSGTAKQAAGQVALTGGLSASMEVAPAETAAGLVALAALKGGAGKVVGPRVKDALDERASGKLLDFSGAKNVRQDGEIIRRAAQEFDDPLREVAGKARSLTTKELNGKVTQSFLREGKDLVEKLPQDFASKPMLEKALSRGVSNTTDEIAALRGVKGGEQVADLIEAAKRTEAVTAAVASSGGLMPAIRYGVQKFLPGVVSEPLNAVLGSRKTREMVSQKAIDKFARGTTKVRENIGEAPSKNATSELRQIVKQADDASLGNIMGAKREQVVGQRLKAEKAVKDLAEKEAVKLAKAQEGQLISEGGRIIAERKAAEKAAEKAARMPSSGSGPKVPTPQVSIADLQAKDPTYLLGLGNRLGAPRNADEMSEFSKVLRLQMEGKAAKQATNTEVQKLSAEIAKGPKVNPKVAALRDQREPLGGAYQYLLSKDANLNLSPVQMKEGLRLLAKRPETPSGSAADIIRKSVGDGTVDDTFAFNALQTRLRQLRDKGVLGNQGTGALSAETASTVRNPASSGVKSAGKSSSISKTISNLTDDEVMTLAGRTKDTLDVPIANLKGYVTTRASRAMKTYKSSPDKVPADDIELLRKLGEIK